MKKAVFLVLVSVMLLAITLPVSAAPKAKVDICHLNGKGNYNLINVSENAKDAHLDHGDALPGSDVPGMEGYIFDDYCSVVEAPNPYAKSGCFVAGDPIFHVITDGTSPQLLGALTATYSDNECKNHSGQPTSAKAFIWEGGQVDALAVCSSAGGTAVYAQLEPNLWACF